MKSPLYRPYLLVLMSLRVSNALAFAPWRPNLNHHPRAAPMTDTRRRRTTSRLKTTTTRLHVAAGGGGMAASRKRGASGTSIAGRLWPAIQKFRLTPAKVKDIVANIKEVTQWQDLVLLGALAFAAMPVAYWSYQRKVKVNGADDENNSSSTMMIEPEDIDDWVEEKPELLPFSALRRFGMAKIISQLSKVALSVYAVDVLSVTLTALGFRFPEAWGVAAFYAKLAYTVFFLQQFLMAKKIFLCRWFKVDSESMGRVEILDRILNGLSFTVVGLLLFDWLSVKMGMAVKGLFAFGSVGTLAFTLASRDLVSSLLSGIFLTVSQKVYVGDSVIFGDGTSGKVIKLGWMETVLRGGDNIVTRVPNTLLSNQKVSNLSRLTFCQVKMTLRFHYEDVEKLPAIMDSIRAEIIKSCPRLIKDGTRPFRVFWTDINEDHLEVMVDTHHRIAPIGDAYWQNRQAVLMAIQRAIKKHEVELAKLYTFATSLSGGETQMKALPKGVKIEGKHEHYAEEDFSETE